MPTEEETLDINDLIENLSRHETGRIVSVLTRIFGSRNLEMAEDVVQDSLIEALGQWKEKGVPDNPTAWLYRVARNKALNVLNREKYKNEYVTEVSHYLQSEWTAEPALNHLFSEEEIQDDQLRMIFTCCHPSISADSQIALALKTLCGFSIPEIARAFLTTEVNIHKRLVRARQKIREDKIPFEVPEGKNLEKRQSTVLETIYLLFNEGYSASKGTNLIRYELCEEAIRLAQMLADDNAIRQKGNVYALLSLMFLDSSRFAARQDAEGNLLTMAEQDRSLWDTQKQRIGLSYLQQSTENGDLSIYHILAAISATYCIAADYKSTDWKNILSLYDSLIQLDSSPLVLLNRAISLSKVHGAESALAELERIKENPSVKSYHLFYSTQAEFYDQLEQTSDAIKSLERAIELAPLPAEKELLEKKKMSLKEKS
ncbi:MAG TPA: sigma-70 family RNA polymerase sigma factor [Candidatus Kapabacteria bacterium]|nr:sigma-70 family RNA polymerase sigma factor [Candidatus Kapabacteria bacterium]